MNTLISLGDRREGESKRGDTAGLAVLTVANLSLK